MIYEWRRYTLRPGLRDSFVSLFERHFVESQEEAGIGLVAMFEDLDRPDVIHWIRKFRDMEVRRHALESFYLHSPAWKEHRDAANATMIDSDDVLLLRASAPVHATGPLFEAAICHVTPDVPPEALREFTWHSEHAENTFPALPVRSDANVAIRLTGSPAPALPDLSPWLTAPVEHLRLAPTPRSGMR
ncbi:NIPSNAP family protein [Nonomuraea soli]|uniref:Quinol monooxygenase YgiN n=1 Tax=Nonomuraea soli TaxID=1032476 RepID=A0A7W0CD36_9ACTN|nr:NIPSNAP family protein [Nonomuraea soli]MBA2888800.1 quinol monooxygenase YgiN [Nonomuraea soli]